MGNGRSEALISRGNSNAASETRRRILDAASDCFDRYSIRLTSMEEVARTSGLSRQTIYRHFQSKGELVASVSEMKSLAITDLVKRRLGKESNSRSKVITAITTCVECLVADRSTREMIEGNFSEIMIRAESARIVSITTDRWLPILEMAAADGTVRTDIKLDQMISWITDAQMLLAMRAIVLDMSPDEVRREVELFVMDGIAQR